MTKKLALTLTLATLVVGIASAEVFEDKSNSPGPSNMGAMPEAAGGPDDFGYIYADNAEAACAGLYTYVDIASTGTAAGLVGVDDGHVGPFPIGFSFDFYGTPQTEFYIGSNGVVYFVDVYLGLSNTCPLPAVQGGYGVDTFIGLYHDDLVIQPDGEVYYETFAACPVGAGGQCTVIQYYNARAYSGTDGDDMDFEVVLFADGSVVMLYQQPSGSDAGQNNGGSATIGIQGSANASPVYAIEYSCNTASLASGLAVAFAPLNATTGGVPNACGQPPTPTPTGPAPIPTTSNTGLIVLALLLVVTALVLIGRRVA